jgi:hypothetical protein
VPEKKLHAMHIPYRSMKPALSHRRTLKQIRQKRVLRKEVRQEQLQPAMKIPLLKRKPQVKVLKSVKRFVRHEVPKKPPKSVLKKQK